jgi:beta-fructofuranosidase
MTLTRRRFLAATATLAAARLAPAEGAVASPLARDPRRPQYHLLPARNWMNDPNGPIYWRGQYHMYFQYNPHAAVWGDMHWAHAVSPDMVHWAHRPVALAPTPGSADADGCFSGTAIVVQGRVAMLYTGVAKAAPENSSIRDGQHNFHEAQLLAWADDASLNSFTKAAAPVILNPPEGMKVTGFRDPSPWRAGARYWMTVGSGIEREGGCVLLYSSRDLVTWQYEHILARGLGAGTQMANPMDAGDMWECPELFALDGKHVLIYSTLGKVYWQVGTLDEQAMLFHAETHGLLDAGSFYASKSQLDKDGKRILWGWVQETRPEAEFSAAGWAGMMSLPRVLSVGPDNRLRSRFLPGLEKLRDVRVRRTGKGKGCGVGQCTDGIGPGVGCLSGVCEVVEEACGEVQYRSAGKSFRLNITRDGSVNVMSVEWDEKVPGELKVDGKLYALGTEAKESLDLHFYVDGSVLEMIAGEQFAMTKRFYWQGNKAPDLQFAALAVAGSEQAMEKWRITAISKNRLTS